MAAFSLLPALIHQFSRDRLSPVGENQISYRLNFLSVSHPLPITLTPAEWIE
jgi:hypothetical protein